MWNCSACGASTPRNCKCSATRKGHGSKPALGDEHKRYLLANALNVAKHHRETCPGEGCAVSLFALYELLRAAGIETDRVTEFL